MKILLVDDDPFSILILKRQLNNLGHEVVVLKTGDDAWAHLQVETFPLLISDWMMPGSIDGLELCRKIRETFGSEIYVILLSAKSETLERERALSVGVDLFLVKPFDRSTFETHIKAVEATLEARTNPD